MDCLQPPGSFKIRGIGRTVQQAVAAGAECIVSSSGGNAGLAAAYAARSVGVPATVVLPTSTPQEVHRRLHNYGAKVLVHGDVWDEADALAKTIVAEQHGAYVHPFDQASTWSGHATLVHELATQLPQAPDAIVTCVGGGGLLMGILEGVNECGWASQTRIVACETEGASSMASSLAQGELVTLPAITSIAKSLGARTVSRDIFERCKAEGPDRVSPFVMTDREAVAACLQLAAHHRVLVEPACGAAVAGILGKCSALQGCKTVVLQVCGGVIVNMASLKAWALDFGLDINQFDP